MIVEVRFRGLDLGMASVFVEWLGDDCQSHGSNIPRTYRRYARAEAADQLQQALRRGNLQPRNRYPRLVSIVTKLKIATGDSRAGSLSRCPTRNVTEKDLLVGDVVHVPCPGLGCKQTQLLQQPHRGAGREFASFGMARFLIEVQEPDGTVRIYLKFVLHITAFPLDQYAPRTGRT